MGIKSIIIVIDAIGVCYLLFIYCSARLGSVLIHSLTHSLNQPVRLPLSNNLHHEKQYQGKTVLFPFPHPRHTHIHTDRQSVFESIYLSDITTATATAAPAKTTITMPTTPTRIARNLHRTICFIYFMCIHHSP